MCRVREKNRDGQRVNSLGIFVQQPYSAYWTTCGYAGGGHFGDAKYVLYPIMSYYCRVGRVNDNVE